MIKDCALVFQSFSVKGNFQMGSVLKYTFDCYSLSVCSLNLLLLLQTFQ